MTAVFDGHTATWHAESVAEGVRAINHITINRDGLDYPSDALQVLQEFARAAAMLPQACEQIGRQLQRWQQAGHIGMDAGTKYEGRPQAAVEVATAKLRAAIEAAGQLHDVLSAAASPLTYAHWTGPEKEPASG